jgi:hypothetical protein
MADTAPLHRAVLRPAAVHVAPFVWSPVFFEAAAAALPLELAAAARYTPRGLAKTVGVFESNSNLGKTALLSLLALETLYTAAPELLASAHIANTDSMLARSDDFVQLVASLAIFRDGVLHLNRRYTLPYALASQGIEVVLSHQSNQGLSYLYLDVLHAGCVISTARALPLACATHPS